MTTKPKMTDMIIILPGITGSVLQKDGKDLWAVSGRAVWRFLTETGKAIQDLTLAQDDPEAEDLGDGIRATSIMQDTHLVPGLWKIDGYTETAKMVTDHFEVVQGDIYNDPDDRAANFYEFPYDWRRDNRVSARILKKLIDKRLKRWRESEGLPNAKVILMAHSMGGLVSRYYLEVLEGWRDSRALFTFGTPYRGSLDAVDFLANGYKQLFLDLTEVMRSLTSIYQLLPIYQVINIDGAFHRVAEAPIRLPNIDNQRAQDALAFHREIEAAVKIHLNDEQYRTDFTTLPISGVSHPTKQSATFANGTLTATEDLPGALLSRPDLGYGDGTVPKVSSIPIELSSNLKNFFIAETHSALQNQEQVLENLLNILRLSQFDIGGIRAPEKAISLSVDDLYVPDEQVTFRARLLGVEGDALNAHIASVSGDRPPLNLAFTQQETEWTLAVDDLPTGLYRISVNADGLGDAAPTPVHDIFEVVRG